MRSAIAAVAEATRLRDRTRLALDRAQARLGTAETRLAQAEAAVIAAREQLIGAIDDWAVVHHEGLLRLAPEVAEHLRDELTQAVDGLGTPDATGLPATFDTVTALDRQARRDELARRQDEMTRRLEEIADWERERAAIADQQDQAPPPFHARTSSRQGRAGAPLWALVDFAPGLDDTAAAAVEAALEAANLLDAWVPTEPDPLASNTEADAAPANPDPGLSDAMLSPLPTALRPKGSTLAQVLVPEPAAAVAESVIAALLASISLEDFPGAAAPTIAPAVSATGQFRQGIAFGAHHKSQAEYIGSTARANRRAARLAALDAQIATGETDVAGTRAAIDDLTDLLSAIDIARKALPATTVAARSIANGRSRRRPPAGDQWRTGQRPQRFRSGRGRGGRHRTTVDQCRRVSRHAGDISMPSTRSPPLLPVSRAMPDNSAQPGRRPRVRDEQLAGAADEVETARDNQLAAAEQAALSGDEHRSRVEELDTLREAVGVGVDQLERDVSATGIELQDADRAERLAQQAVNAAIEEAGERKGLAEGAATGLVSAVTEAQRDSHRLAPYARPDIRDTLKITATISEWPTATEQWSEPVDLVADAADLLLQDPDATDRRPCRPR